MVKSLHELGHAYATKVWGGEVHEVGVMLLVFIPVPYVDASASAAFRQKRRRIVVGAAGILVETGARGDRHDRLDQCAARASAARSRSTSF